MIHRLLIIGMIVAPSTAFALGNPASIFCEAHGGKSVVETAANGAQTGFCVFPNGTKINERAYFRSMHRTHN